MFRGVAGVGQRNLVCAPGSRGLLAVDVGRAGPSLRGAEDDHRPAWPLFVTAGGLGLDLRDLVEHGVEQHREPTVCVRDVVVLLRLEEVRVVAVTDHQAAQFVGRNAGQHRRIRDLVAVQMQDWQHHAVLGGVHELVGMPARRERSGLRLTVADDRGDEQVRVVERGAVGVRERVAQLAALVDRARRLGSDVRRNAAREGELPKQPPQTLGVAGDVGVDLRIGAVEVGVGDQARTAVTWAGDVDRRLSALLDHPVQMRVEEVQARRGSPMAEQAGLDVVARERGAQQRVVQQVDLAHRQVVRSAPPAVDLQ